VPDNSPEPDVEGTEQLLDVSAGAEVDREICGGRAVERQDAIELGGSCHLDNSYERGPNRPTDFVQTKARRRPGLAPARHGSLTRRGRRWNGRTRGRRCDTAPLRRPVNEEGRRARRLVHDNARRKTWRIARPLRESSAHRSASGLGAIAKGRGRVCRENSRRAAGRCR
jgi:hypothetical protein